MMKPIAGWLSALLVAALLLTPAAMAEAAPEGEVVAVEEAYAPTDDAPEDAPDITPEEDADATPEDIPAEAANIPEEAVVAGEVDAVVCEASDIALDEAVELREEAPEDTSEAAQPVEALPEDLADDAPSEETPVPQTGADEAVAEESPEASAKVMEASGEIPIDEAHFPDAGFRAYLTQGTPLGCVDQDGNGALSEAERNAVLLIQLNGTSLKPGVAQGSGVIEGEDYTPYYLVQSLEGIGFFPNLTALECSGVGLVSLDVSQNKALQTLRCENNNLTALTVGNLPELKTVHCRYNQLTALNLRGCPKVSGVMCYGNRIKKIHVSKNGRFKDTRTRYFIVVNGKRKYTTLKKHPEAYQSVVPVRERGAINCDRKVRIVRADTPFTPTPGYELIAATKDYTKATVLIGTIFQINPGASAGYAFKSSKKKVAAVDKNGIVATTGAGNAKLTFKVGRRKRTLSLTVVDPTMPSNVVLDLAVTYVKKGDVVTLTPAVPEGTDPGGFRWKSSNKKVATVKDGVVSFLKAGRVTITATAVRGGKKDSLTFTVSN
ncbi:MAG: Ig-like domain-containing protein [Clostridia bacterium]|nr:Ig-like domain-containing protein [Clostridia bacterium]